MNGYRLIAALADLLWPPLCAACSSRITSTATKEICSVFCPRCQETLLFTSKPLCSKCGIPFEGTGPSHLCAQCLKEPPAFSHARAPLLYGGAAAEALKRFKYGQKPHLSGQLAKLLTLDTTDKMLPDMVIPVPLHSTRLRSRGFNQSALLAHHVATRINAPFSASLLKRNRKTKSQAGLTRAQRQANLKGAFCVPKKSQIAGLKVLLVDDVITTTATVREAAKTLSRAGAQSVEVIALARAT